MDRQNEQVELFRAYTIEELREQEASVVGGKFYDRGENSSSYFLKA